MELEHVKIEKADQLSRSALERVTEKTSRAIFLARHK
jgi:hypothetical protein